jgi:ankyrin repeat protein
MNLLNNILAWTAKRNNLTLVKWLIKLGADPKNALYEYDNTILHLLLNSYKTKNYPKKVIEYLIDSEYYNVDSRNRSGNTILDFVCNGENVDSKLLERLLEKGYSISNKNRYGFYPLLNFCIYGHNDLVKKLLKLGANPLDAGPYGLNCLHLTCLHGRLNIFELLTKWLVENDKISELKRYKDDISLLHLSCNSLNRSLAYKKLPFYESLSNGNDSERLQIVYYLINAEIDIDETNYPYPGVTPLLIACENDFIEAVKLLINKGADVNRKSTIGDTPLMIASRNGNIYLVRLLCENGAIINEKANVIAPLTALSYARLEGHHDIIAYLKENGAKDN